MGQIINEDSLSGPEKEILEKLRTRIAKIPEKEKARKKNAEIFNESLKKIYEEIKPVVSMSGFHTKYKKLKCFFQK